MANDITFVHFRYGTYAEINNSAKNSTLNPHAVYIATDKQLMYAKGAWIGVTSVTSDVNQDTGEITLKFNYDSEGQPTGNPITCTISGAGMTTEQKDHLATAYNFVVDIAGTSADSIINKWQEVVDFLAGIEGGTLEGIVATKADKTTTITAGNGLTGGGDLSANRTITLGTPSTITDNSTNSVTAESHTHAIDEASTTKRGIVQLNDTLTSDSTIQSLTAKQGKKLKGLIDSETNERKSADNTLQTNISSLQTLLNSLFTPHYASDGLTLESIEANAGFWSKHYISAKDIDDTEASAGGVNLTSVWESLTNNSDTFKDTLINIAHIPNITVSKITDFTSKVTALIPTNVSAFNNDAGYLTSSAIANKADKATTLAGYGITDAFTWKGIAPSDGTDTALWGEYGMLSYNGILPDGLSAYSYGILASFSNGKGTGTTAQIYIADNRDNSQTTRHVAWRSGWVGTKGPWHKLANIDSLNIFSEKQTFSAGVILNSNTVVTTNNTFSLGENGYSFKSVYSNQFISQVATGTAPLSVASSTLVTSLNADMVDGLHATHLGVLVDNKQIDLNSASEYTFRGGKVFNAPNAATPESSYRGFLEYGSTNYRAQFNSGDINDLYYRWCENGTWRTWRQFAFTDSNVASATKLQTARTIWGQSFDGTANVTGAMSDVTSINSLLYLNSTGLGIGISSPSYKLDVSGDIHSTSSTFLNGATKSTNSGTQSLAVGTSAYALGPRARSLSEHSYAGIRTGNSTYPYAYITSYDTLAFTVDDSTVYGSLILPNSTLTYTYGGTTYMVSNTTSYVQILTIINGGELFCGSSVYPYNRGALANGPSVGRGYKILNVIDLSNNIYAIIGYTYESSFALKNDTALKLYAYTLTAASNYSGNSSVASGYYSVASGNYSVASGNYSVASGNSSVASGNSSVASGNSSVASGYYSVASGNYSVASGYYSVASGNSSVASGYYSVASHESSKVFATRGISGRNHQTVLGYYNAEDTNSALVVGWGTNDTNRKNVFTVGTDGSVFATGLITTQIGIKIGDATLSWDSANGCVKIDKGFASDSFISAKGVDNNEQTIAELQARVTQLEAQVASLSN